MHHPIFLLLLLILLFPSPSLPQEQQVTDTTRLLGFKSGITSDPSGQFSSSWTSDFSDSRCPGTFYGVKCDGTGEYVVSIALDGLGLSGYVDLSTLSTMTSLQNLSLSNNNLTGTLTASIGFAVSLQWLDLSNNRFSGPVPFEIGKLGRLSYLNLSFNTFSGEFPGGALWYLTELKVIDLRSNYFSSDVRNLLAGFRNNTEYVDLSGNSFNGSLWMYTTDLQNVGYSVKYLNMSWNQLKGIFFEFTAVSVFRSLETLDVSHNELDGSLPSFEVVRNLKVFWATDNKLSRSLPVDFFGNSTQLVDLDLRRNSFSDYVPNIYSTSLQHLKLSSNSLYGSLPSSIGICTDLDLSNNLISGELTGMQSWGVTLEFLDLSSNKLFGNFPELIYQLQSLRSIKISNNSLQGSLPYAFESYTNLSVLDLSHNQLTGPLYRTFFVSPSLAYLNLSANFFGGTIPFQETNSSKLPMETLDLSDNSLTGPLSTSIVSMQKLKSLSLSKNSLSGEIPIEIGKLSLLEHLDLSSNKFEGEIPDVRLPNLTSLDLTRNNLSGVIPTSLKDFPNSSFHPGNDLLGVAPRSPPPGQNSQGNHSDVMNSVGIPEDQSPSRINVTVAVGCVGSVMLLLIMCTVVYKVRSQANYDSNGFKVRRSGANMKCGKFPSVLFQSPRKETRLLSRTYSSDRLLKSAIGSRCMSTQTSGDSTPQCVLSSSGELSNFSSQSELMKLEVPGKDLPVSVLSPSPCSSPLGSSPIAILPEKHAVLDVHTPDWFEGELYLEDSQTFTIEELSVAPAEVIGRGCHGTSYKATLSSGQILRVKWLRVGHAKRRREFSREIKRIGSIEHPNIVPLRGYYWGPREQERLIISDYVIGDNLAARLDWAKSKTTGRAPLTLSHRLKIATNVAQSLCFLHQEKGLPHGNLKSSNILLSGPNLEAKLTDYGFHNLITAEASAEQLKLLGAMGYRAPELEDSPKPIITFKADVYAFGVILMELFTGKSGGDIVSGQPEAVDLTDWVLKCAQQGKKKECFDQEIASVEEAPRAMSRMLDISLKCIFPVNERPTINVILGDLCAIRP